MISPLDSSLAPPPLSAFPSLNGLKFLYSILLSPIVLTTPFRKFAAIWRARYDYCLCCIETEIKAQRDQVTSQRSDNCYVKKLRLCYTEERWLFTGLLLEDGQKSCTLRPGLVGQEIKSKSHSLVLSFIYWIKPPILTQFISIYLPIHLSFLEHLTFPVFLIFFLRVVTLTALKE